MVFCLAQVHTFLLLHERCLQKPSLVVREIWLAEAELFSSLRDGWLADSGSSLIWDIYAWLAGSGHLCYLKEVWLADSRTLILPERCRISWIRHLQLLERCVTCWVRGWILIGMQHWVWKSIFSAEKVSFQLKRYLFSVHILSYRIRPLDSFSTWETADWLDLDFFLTWEVSDWLAQDIFLPERCLIGWIRTFFLPER